MVTVVDRGPHHSVVKEVICRNCGSKLSYVPMDIKEKSGHNERDGSWGNQWIDCPVCAKKVNIKSW